MTNFCRYTPSLHRLKSVTLPFLLGISLLLGACMDSNNLQLAEGIGGTGITRGSVGIGMTSTSGSNNSATPPPTTKTATLTVAGIEFAIDHAIFKNCHSIENISDNVGKPGIGDFVEVEGTINPDGQTGTATVVSCSTLLDGTVTGAYNGTSLQVMQQTVIIDANTLAYGFALSSLQPGDLVIVSGYTDTQGNMHASKIQKISATSLDDGVFSIHGLVSQLDTGMLTFKVNGLTVDYAHASITDLPPTGFQNGMHVFITTQQAIENNTLLAFQIAVTPTNTSTSTHYRIEGYIAHVISPTEFEVAGQRVIVTPTTNLPNAGAETLLENNLVQVSGTVNAEGVLVADEIKTGSMSQQSGDTGTNGFQPWGNTDTPTLSLPVSIDMGTDTSIPMTIFCPVATPSGLAFISMEITSASTCPALVPTVEAAEATPSATATPVIDTSFTLQSVPQGDN